MGCSLIFFMEDGLSFVLDSIDYSLQNVLDKSVEENDEFVKTQMNKQPEKHECAACGRKPASQTELSEHGKTCSVAESEKNG